MTSSPLRLRDSILACLLLMAGMASTSQAQQGGVFDVLDYGALPNDGESDFLGSRAAIAAAAAAGGGTVFYPCGTYTSGTYFWEGVFRILSGENDIWIRGEDKACVTFEVHADAIGGMALGATCPDDAEQTNCNTHLYELPVPSDIRISGITFHDPDPPAHASANIEESHGLYTYCERCEIFDVELDQIGDEGLDFFYSKNVWVHDVSCRSMGVPSGPGINAGTCVNIQNSQNMLVEDVRCEDPVAGPASVLGSTCFRIEQFKDERHPKGIVVERLTTENFSGIGIFLTASSGMMSDISILDSTINSEGNTQYAVTTQSSSPRNRLKLVGNTFNGPVRIGHAANLVFSDNVVDALRGPGVEYIGVVESITANNTIRNAPEQCIYVHTGGAQSLTGNRCENVGGAGYRGIEINRFFVTEGRIDVVGNTVEMAPGGTDGIRVPNDLPITVRDNVVIDPGGTGIGASGAITGNVITGVGGSGVRVWPSNGASVVADNTIDGSGGACVEMIPGAQARVVANQVTGCAE